MDKTNTKIAWMKKDLLGLEHLLKEEIELILDRFLFTMCKGARTCQIL